MPEYLRFRPNQSILIYIDKLQRPIILTHYGQMPANWIKVLLRQHNRPLIGPVLQAVHAENFYELA